VTPPINASAIPPFDGAAGSSYIQILLSSYTFETAIYTFFKVIVLTCPDPPRRTLLRLFGAVLSPASLTPMPCAAGRLARLRAPSQPGARRPEQHRGLWTHCPLHELKVCVGERFALRQVVVVIAERALLSCCGFRPERPRRNSNGRQHHVSAGVCK
jgi:hypothetical protein